MSNGFLDGKVALITGASRGIGAAVAERFSAEGARVGLVARTRDKHPQLGGSLNETLARCRSHGANADMIVADLADPEEWSRIGPKVAELLGGPVDILVNNAAASIYRPIADYEPADMRQTFEVNVIAPVGLIQSVLPGMVDRQAGWVINLGSATAEYDQGTPGVAPQPGGLSSTLAVYAASKAALNRLTFSLAQELRGTGVRVNSIAPKSAVFTEATGVAFGGKPDPKFLEPIEAMTEAVLLLARCPEDMTGGTFRSLALLEATGTKVMSLDGKTAHVWDQA
jgi:NAD(P)-dependent dehydrogenase (short-subunit alcohol dehydrogenase family)